MGKCGVCGAKGNEIIVKSLVDVEPSPTEGTGPAIWDLVIEEVRSGIREILPTKHLHIADKMVWDAQSRDEFGIEKYKTRLKVPNGRDNLVDAYQEQLDYVVYLRAEIEDKQLDSRRMTTHPIVKMYLEGIQNWFSLRKYIYDRDGK